MNMTASGSGAMAANFTAASSQMCLPFGAGVAAGADSGVAAFASPPATDGAGLFSTSSSFHDASGAARPALGESRGPRDWMNVGPTGRSQRVSSAGSMALLGALAVFGVLLPANALAFDVPAFDPGREIYEVGRVTYESGAMVDFRRAVRAAADDGEDIYLLMYRDIETYDPDLAGGQNRWPGEDASHVKEASRRVRNLWARDARFNPDSVVIVWDTGGGFVPGEGGIDISLPIEWGAWNMRDDWAGSFIDRYFIPSYEQRDFDGAASSLLAGISSGIEGRMAPLEQALNEKIKRARDILADSAVIAEDNPQELRIALEWAEAISKNRKHTAMRHADNELGREIARVSGAVGGRKKALDDLLGSIQKSEGLFSHAELTDDAQTKRELSAALANARRVHLALDHAAALASRIELARIQGIADGRARTRAGLNDAIVRARGAESSPYIKKGGNSQDDLGALRKLAGEADDLRDSDNYTAMGRAAESLKSEIARVDKIIADREAYARDLKAAQGELERGVESFETALRDNAKLLAGHDLAFARDGIDSAKAMISRSDIDSVRSASSALTSVRNKFDEIVDKRNVEITRALALKVAGGVVGLGALIFLGANVFSFRRRRKEFLRSIEEWEEKIEAEFGRLAAIHEIGDESVSRALASLGGPAAAWNSEVFGKSLHDRIEKFFENSAGKTREMYERYQELYGRTSQSLEFMRQHIADAKSATEGSSWLGRKGLARANAAMDDIRDGLRVFFHGKDIFGVAKIAEGNGPLSLGSFRRKFEGASYAELGQAWQRMLDSVRNAGKTAREQFGAENLDRMIANLKEAGAPPAWISSHPLYADREAKWAEMDGMRADDPVSFAELISKLHEEEGDLAALVDTLAAGADLVRQKKVLADAMAEIEYAKTALDPKDDPREAAREAGARQGLFDSAIMSANDIEDVKTKAVALIEAYDEMMERNRNLKEAMDNCETWVRGAEDAISDAKAALSAARDEHSRLTAVHDVASRARVLAEIAEAGRDAEAADSILAKIRTSLLPAEGSGGEIVPNHMMAARVLKDAVAAIRSMKLNIEDIHGAMRAIEDDRQRYLKYRKSLDGELYRSKIDAMSAYRPFNDEELLRSGRDLRDSLPMTEEEVLSAGPVNWAQRVEELRRVEALMDRGVEIAKNSYSVRDADQQIGDLEERLAKAERMVAETESGHDDRAIAELRRELREAREAVKIADEARDRANVLLTEGKDKEAAESARKALQNRIAAVREIEDVTAEIGKLDEFKSKFERCLREMNDSRSDYSSSLHRYSGFGHGVLGKGDDILDRIGRAASAGRPYYATLLRSLGEVEEAWESGVRRAKREHEEHEEELRRQERRRREAAEAARRAMYRSSHSSFSSSPGRSSFSGGSRGGSSRRL